MMILSRSALLLAAVLVPASLAQAADPLPSWTDGPTKAAIESFVKRVTDRSDPDYVPPADRIAVFDNDGNLWAEKPVYFQLLFAIDRVKALAPEHPEWRDQEPFKSAIAGDLEGVAKSGTEGLAKIVAASHAGMSTADFAAISKEWLNTAKHPQTGRKYTEMVQMQIG